MRITLIAITLSFGLGAVLAGCATPHEQSEAIENDGSYTHRGIRHRIPDGHD